MTGSGFGTGTTGEPAPGPFPFDLLAQHAPCPWALVDPAGAYRYISPAFVGTFGYTLDELRTEQDWFERAFPDPLERERARRAWCGEGGPAGPPLVRVRCRDGLDRTVLLRCVALEDGSRLEVYEDVSELVRHQEALEAANRRLADIIEFLPDPTFVIDRAGTVIAWNRAIEALSGVPKAEMLGRGNEAYATAIYGHPRPLLIDLVLSGASAGLEAYTEIEAGTGTLVAETFVPSWNDGAGAYLWGKASLLFTPGGEVAGAIESIRDITGRKRTEHLLRQSERTYRDLVESINDIIYAIDPAGRITYISPVVAHVAGYAPAELVGHPYFELVHPDDLEVARSGLASAIADQSRQNEFRMIARSGETRWVRTLTRPVRAGGAVVELRGVLTDITDRKLAEIALARSEALLARMTEASPFGYYVVDTRTDGVLYFNERFLEIWGFQDLRDRLCRGQLRNSDLVVRLLALASDPASVDGAGAAFDDPENRAVIEDEIGLADGRTLRRFSAPLRDDLDRFYGRLFLFEDITGQQRMVAELRRYRDELEELVRERTEELTRVNESLLYENTERMLAMRARAESEDRLDRIFQQAPIGMAVVSLDDRFLRVNDALCRITGYTRDALLAMGPYDITHPDDVGAGRELAGRLVRDEFEEYVREKRYVRADGATVCVHITIGVVRDRAGAPLHLLSMVEDVTERRRADEQLRVYAEALRESNKDLQQFAYVASHDLQEPLRSIISFAQLLERRYRGQLGEDADEYIAFIVDGGMRMQQLITDLLQLSRVETRGAPLSPTATGTVVADVITALETPIREAGATVEVGEMPEVMADAAQLEQVFVNLVGNALKYRRPGTPPVVRISAERREGSWCFAVRDNGIGIEAEYFDRIFVIFQRLHTRTEFEGTGIGLAVAKRIIDRHGGRIWLESAPGEGSTFFFTLPAA